MHGGRKKKEENWVKSVDARNVRVFPRDRSPISNQKKKKKKNVERMQLVTDFDFRGRGVLFRMQIGNRRCPRAVGAPLKGPAVVCIPPRCAR